MAIKPNKVPGFGRPNPLKKWVNSWEKSIDSFLAAGKYHRLKDDFQTIQFSSTEVRKFVRKKLPRKNKLIDDQLEARYREAGWAGIVIVGEQFYFSTKPRP